MRGQTIEITAAMVTETCCRSDCGILFAVPAEWQQVRRRDHTDFYCPNGHPQAYYSKSEEETLREKLQQVQSNANYYSARAKRLEDDNMTLANKNRALRGVATKLKRRAAAGLCAFCNRTFANVARHVSTKHPGACSEEAAD